ncbi:diguanylate cyclase domain-containing protein, partial [Marinimicrobium sp. LS-A18]|uniref:diguanylate cyclase domain-containing protein n=1 Tax=Marinimicrobium sp. LS-A18 TaxID=1381596 RepID=UPI000463A936
ARHIGQCINRAVRELSLEHRHSPVGDCVTVSIGGATCHHSMGHTLEEVIKCADRALYRVKHKGRDSALIEEVATHKTVLIVARGTDRTREISEPLQQHCNILTTDTAEECLEIASDVLPDVIISDGESAFAEDHSLFRLLARSTKSASTPILVVSDDPERPDLLSDLEGLGPVGWLKCPFSAAELRTKVQMLLD